MRSEPIIYTAPREFVGRVETAADVIEWCLIRLKKPSIGSPNSWTKGAYARNPAGDPDVEASSTASCFCLAGVMHLANVHEIAPISVINQARDALERAVNPYGFGSVINYNDHPKTTFRMIRALLGKTICKLRTA